VEDESLVRLGARLSDPKGGLDKLGLFKVVDIMVDQTASWLNGMAPRKSNSKPTILLKPFFFIVGDASSK
jgi:hypothetical protein